MRSAEDVSLLMFVALRVGVTLWLVHGFIKGEVAIIATNAVTLVLGAAFVRMKAQVRIGTGGLTGGDRTLIQEEVFR